MGIASEKYHFNLKQGTRSGEKVKVQIPFNFSPEIWSLIIKELSLQGSQLLSWDQTKETRRIQATLSNLSRSSKWLKDLIYPSLHDNLYLEGFFPTETFLKGTEGKTFATRFLRISLSGPQPNKDSISTISKLLPFLQESLPNLESLTIEDQSELHPECIQFQLEIPIKFVLPTSERIKYCRWEETLINVELKGVEVKLGEDENISDDEEEDEFQEDLAINYLQPSQTRGLKSLDLSNSILDSYLIYCLIGSKSLRSLESLILRNVKDLEEELGIALRRISPEKNLEKEKEVEERQKDRITRLKHLDLCGTGLERFLKLSEEEFKLEVKIREKRRLGTLLEEEEEYRVEFIVDGNEDGDGDGERYEDFWEYQDSERSDDVDERPEKEEEDRAEWFGLEKEPKEEE